MNKKYAYAKRCISCLRRPTSWSGHFHLDNKIIIAGFCSRHKKERAPNIKGVKVATETNGEPMDGEKKEVFTERCCHHCHLYQMPETCGCDEKNICQLFGHAMSSRDRFQRRRCVQGNPMTDLNERARKIVETVGCNCLYKECQCWKFVAAELRSVVQDACLSNEKIGFIDNLVKKAKSEAHADAIKECYPCEHFDCEHVQCQIAKRIRARGGEGIEMSELEKPKHTHHECADLIFSLESQLRAADELAKACRESETVKCLPYIKSALAAYEKVRGGK